MSGRLDISADDLRTFETRLRQARSSEKDIFDLRFYRDEDYESLKADVKTSKTSGAVLQIARSCKSSFLPLQYATETLDSWESEMNVIVAVSVKEGNAGIGYITITKGMGNSGEKSLEYENWITIDIVCVMEAYRNKGIGGALLACALHLAWKKGYTNCAIHLAGGANNNVSAYRTYARFGFQKDRELNGFFKEPGERQTREGVPIERNVKNDDKTSTLMSVDITKIRPELIYTDNLSRSSKIFTPKAPGTASPKPQDLTSARKAAEAAKNLELLEIELNSAKSQLDDWKNKYKALQTQLQLALDEKEASKRELSAAKTKIDAQNDEIVRLSKPRTPSQDTEELKKLVNRQQAEIEDLRAQLGRVVVKPKRPKIVSMPPTTIDLTTFAYNEEEKLRMQKEEEAARKEAAEREAQRERARIEKEQADRLLREEEIRRQQVAREPSGFRALLGAIEEEKVAEEPEAEEEKIVRSKYFATSEASSELSQDEKQSVRTAIHDVLQKMQKMRKDEAISYCKKFGCPICGDRPDTHQYVMIVQAQKKKKAKATESEAGDFRVRYNTLDGYALCNACYSVLYGKTTSDAVAKYALADFVVAQNVVTRRKAVQMALEALATVEE